MTDRQLACRVCETVGEWVPSTAQCKLLAVLQAAVAESRLHVDMPSARQLLSAAAR